MRGTVCHLESRTASAETVSPVFDSLTWNSRVSMLISDAGMRVPDESFSGSARLPKKVPSTKAA